MILYGAVIPSLDTDTKKEGIAKDKAYNANTAAGWERILQEARKMQ